MISRRFHQLLVAALVMIPGFAFAGVNEQSYTPPARLFSSSQYSLECALDNLKVSQDCDSLERVLTALRSCLPVSHWRGTYQLGNYRVQFAEGNKSHWDPASFDDLFAASRVRTPEFNHRIHYAGYGLPLVAVRNMTPERIAAEPFSGKLSFSTAATLVVDFTGDHSVRVRLVNPYQSSEQVAVDYTAPIAFRVQHVSLMGLDLGGFRKPEEYQKLAGLYMVTPYDPGRIPVVFVHGLDSSPLTWLQVVNDLQANPAIQKRYQFWVFYYPTGNPVLYSASILRKDLNRIRNHYDPSHRNKNLDQMILIGHSMGGLLSRLMVSSADSHFIKGRLGVKSLDELDVDPETMAKLRESTNFKSQAYIKRVVFVATPHRGSELATGVIGGLGKQLISLPKEFATLPGRITRKRDANAGEQYANEVSFKIPTSIENLEPGNHFLETLNTLPIQAPYHSIIGDEGGPCNPAGTDGVVPYCSSHLENARSEIIVQSGHEAHQSPVAIQELERILMLHAKPAKRGN